MAHWLGVFGELEGLVVLEGGLDVVVVRVEPLHHLQRRNINTVFLVSSAHGEALVDGTQVVLAVSLRDDIEHLELVQDLVIVGEVIAGDDIDTGVLLDLPVLQTQSLALCEQLIL